MIQIDAGLASTSYVRPDGQLVIHVLLQDTSGFIRKVRWDQNGWTKDTEPPLFKAKLGARMTATGWASSDGEHVRVYYFTDSNEFSEYCMDNGNWQHGSKLPQ